MGSVRKDGTGGGRADTGLGGVADALAFAVLHGEEVEG